MAERAPDLGAQIDFEIRTTGPMSLASYMGLCLTHPERGYYRTAAALGAAGDFVTAPEISQMFGEVIGAFVADLFVQMGSPARLTLLELGPGRGSLAADLMRVACRVPGFANAVQLALYETHPGLQAQQRERLAAHRPVFVDDLEALADAPILVIANEFFDALPIRQFVRRSGAWHERRVGLEGDRRVFGLDPTPFPATAIPEGFAGAGEGEVAEVGLAATQMMERVARVIAPRGGALLALDYGHAHTQPGETLQGVRGHTYADPLEAPGRVDLSSHVDFEALARAARMAGLNTPPLVTQGRFLSSLGIAQRADALMAANPDQAQAIAQARDRLVGEDGMGTLFKVMCAASPGLVPAGFAAGA